MVSPDMNGGGDEEAEAVRIAIALSLGEDPDAPQLGTANRSTQQAQAREARERAQERQRIRIRDQAKDAALDHPNSSYYSSDPNLDADRHAPRTSPNSNAKTRPSGTKREMVTVDLTLDDDDDDDDDDDGYDGDKYRKSHSDIPNKPPSMVVPKGKPDSVPRGQSQPQGDLQIYQAQRNAETSLTPSGGSDAGSSGLIGVLGGLNRKQMEEERLARLKKRKAAELTEEGGDNASTTGSEVGVIPTPASSESRPSRRQKVDWASSTPLVSHASSLPSMSTKPHPISTAKTESSTTPGSVRSVPYPRGVVKKTWCRSQPRLGDDIKIEEVLQKDKLKLAVLSSFQWDDVWLMSKLNITQTRVILIAFAADEAQQEEMVSNVPRDRIRFCFPPVHGIGHMHSKLQLLKYDDYLRIVVPTGNLVPYDWGETGVMENMVFIIDLPKLDSTVQKKIPFTTFGQDLSYFLSAQGLDDRLVDSLGNYDFSETERYGFVHSICGSTSDDDWRRTGYCGLGRAVDGLRLTSQTPVEVDYVCASLGALNNSLLNAIYYACQGDAGLEEYQARTTKDKGEASSRIKKHMRVYFPSEETVMRSRGGQNAAGTICFQSRWHQASTFPREVLRDCKSTRPGILMHSKVIFVRRQDPNSGSANGGPSGFAYLGSANLSESAWGRLVKDRGSGKLKITCRNWECGVIIPADSRPHEDEHEHEHEQPGDWGIFDQVLPVPMEHPGAPLSDKGPQRPWFFQERR